MHDIHFEYDPSDQPHAREIVNITVGSNRTDIDVAWIESLGEIILRIPCVDGIVYIVRADAYKIKDLERLK